MNNKHPIALEELKKLRKPVRNINVEHHEKLTRLEHFAIWINKKVGTMSFFFLILAWTISWIGWNLLAPVPLRFDVSPTFELWLLVSSIIQILLIPLILVGQNFQSRHQEARTEADFEVNVKVEREVETVLAHLEHQKELIGDIMKKLEEK